MESKPAKAVQAAIVPTAKDKPVHALASRVNNDIQQYVKVCQTAGGGSQASACRNNSCNCKQVRLPHIRVAGESPSSSSPPSSKNSTPPSKTPSPSQSPPASNNTKPSPPTPQASIKEGKRPLAGNVSRSVSSSVPVTPSPLPLPSSSPSSSSVSSSSSTVASALAFLPDDRLQSRRRPAAEGAPRRRTAHHANEEGSYIGRRPKPTPHQMLLLRQQQQSGDQSVGSLATTIFAHMLSEDGTADIPTRRSHRVSKTARLSAAVASLAKDDPSEEDDDETDESDEERREQRRQIREQRRKRRMLEEAARRAEGAMEEDVEYQDGHDDDMLPRRRGRRMDDESSGRRQKISPRNANSNRRKRDGDEDMESLAGEAASNASGDTTSANGNHLDMLLMLAESKSPDAQSANVGNDTSLLVKALEQEKSRKRHRESPTETRVARKHQAVGGNRSGRSKASPAPKHIEPPEKPKAEQQTMNDVLQQQQAQLALLSGLNPAMWLGGLGGLGALGSLGGLAGLSGLGGLGGLAGLGSMDARTQAELLRQSQMLSLLGLQGMGASNSAQAHAQAAQAQAQAQAAQAQAAHQAQALMALANPLLAQQLLLSSSMFNPQAAQQLMALIQQSASSPQPSATSAPASVAAAAPAAPPTPVASVPVPAAVLPVSAPPSPPTSSVSPTSVVASSTTTTPPTPTGSIPALEAQSKAPSPIPTQVASTTPSAHDEQLAAMQLEQQILLASLGLQMPATTPGSAGPAMQQQQLARQLALLGLPAGLAGAGGLSMEALAMLGLGGVPLGLTGAAGSAPTAAATPAPTANLPIAAGTGQRSTSPEAPSVPSSPAPAAAPSQNHVSRGVDETRIEPPVVKVEPNVPTPVKREPVGKPATSGSTVFPPLSMLGAVPASAMSSAQTRTPGPAAVDEVPAHLAPLAQFMQLSGMQPSIANISTLVRWAELSDRVHANGKTETPEEEMVVSRLTRDPSLAMMALYARQLVTQPATEAAVASSPPSHSHHPPVSSVSSVVPAVTLSTATLASPVSGVFPSHTPALVPTPGPASPGSAASRKKVKKKKTSQTGTSNLAGPSATHATKPSDSMNLDLVAGHEMKREPVLRSSPTSSSVVPEPSLQSLLFSLGVKQEPQVSPTIQEDKRPAYVEESSHQAEMEPNRTVANDVKQPPFRGDSTSPKSVADNESDNEHSE